MAAIATLPVLFQTGDHASRPAAGDVGSGGLYSCTDHDLLYQTDGSSWTTWGSLGASGELDYVQITSGVTITATTEAGATTIVTGNAVAYDGSTTIIVEFCGANISLTGSAGNFGYLHLFDGSTSLGYHYTSHNLSGSATYFTPYFRARLTPSAATHTYSVRGSKNAGTVVLGAGAGGAGNDVPAFIRISKA